MRAKGKIHLGDLTRALHILGWEDVQQAKKIGSFLGFDLSQLPDTPRHADSADPRLDSKEPANLKTRKKIKKPVFPQTPEIPPILPTQRSSSVLSKHTQPLAAAPQQDEWQNKPDSIFNQPEKPELPRRNLFANRNSRHLFSAALSTQRESHEIDIPKLIDSLCNDRYVIDIPRLQESTLLSGCHLLRDFSQTMVPWWDDLMNLSEQIGQVIGAAKVHSYHFDTSPQKPARWTMDGKRQFWQADGTPVLVATDFGIQGPSFTTTLDKSWQQFIEHCEQAGSPLICLIPWPKAYWPRDISNHLQLIHWSPHTTVDMIKKAIADCNYTGR